MARAASTSNGERRRSSRLIHSNADQGINKGGDGGGLDTFRKRVKSEQEDRNMILPKPERKPKRAKKEEGTDDAEMIKKRSEKKLASLRQNMAKEPFPEWEKPSEEEARHVADLLRIAHSYRKMPQKQPPKGDDRYGGCGDVSDVLDATIRTILSCNTSGANSTAAHKSLCDTFGKCNWQAILDAKHEEVANAIKCGGLHDNKARTIQGVLKETLKRHGKLSLDHLHGADAKTVMEELVSFNGVGPKVASCVAMFALGLSEMAVDTHVFRICRKLNWVPQNATRDQTYYHLAARIPNDLKYPLHVLLIKHGKACCACSARGFATDRYDSPEWEQEGMNVISGMKEEDWEKEERAKAEKKNKKIVKFPARTCPLNNAGYFKRAKKERKKAKEEKEDIMTIKKEEDI